MPADSQPPLPAADAGLQDIYLGRPLAPDAEPLHVGIPSYLARAECVYNALGNGGFDALAVHTYTHGANPNLIYSTAKMDPPYQNRHYHFRAYRDYMNAVPSWARSLPAYITETDQNDPWADVNSGWVRNAYGDIHWWNQQAGNQKIRALILYRWPQHDQWYITGKWGVINDWRAAMDNDYRWTDGTSPPPPPPPPPGGGGFPDVVVESITTFPASPAPGDAVTFQAVVKNRD